MAMRAFQVPWWLSAGYLAGLLFVFIGQRALGHLDGASTMFTWLGVIMMGASLGVRGWTLSKAPGQSRRVELYTVLTYLGGLAALGLYSLTTEWGLGIVGLADADAEAVTRFTTPVTVLWSIVLVVSIVPMIMIELAEGFTERSAFVFVADPNNDAAVETFRIRQLATSGLTIGLALSFLFVTCQASEEYDVRKDVSYFKTSSPGSATVSIVNSVSEPLQVYLFFPDVNEVKNEVANYFESLASETHKVEVHDVERFRDVELTKKYKVNKNGTVVIVRGDKDEKFTLSDDIQEARRKQLRTLDETVQKSLLKVVRAKRIAYLTTGHGELNSPETVGALGFEGPKLKATLIKEALKRLNYEVKDLSPFDLVGGVPDDATMIISLAPQRSFTEEEERALDTYLGEGGALLLSLDPRGEAVLGPQLTGRLGVRYVNTALADDKEFIPQRQNASDHGFLKTNQFSAHASVTTLSRRGSRQGIVLIRPGYLEDAPFEVKGEPKRTYVVRTMASSFADPNTNFVFDADSEKRDRYNIAAAIEDPKAVKASGDGEVQPREGMRAMVVSDAESFSDPLLVQVPLLQDLLFDSLKWLGGEERFSGETKNEEDQKIEHSKSEDVVYFYLTIILAPLFVLGLGLLVNWLRRRSIKRRAS